MKEEPEFERLDPLTTADFIKVFRNPFEWDTKQVTLQEALDQYGDLLTDEQIQKLKEYAQSREI